MNVDITGPRILLSIPALGGFMLTESVVTTWIVMLILVLICRFLTKDMQVRPQKKRQVIAEWMVTSIQDLVKNDMGDNFLGTIYVPFIGALFALSAGCSISSVFGAKAPTRDLSTVLGWGVLVFILITYNKIKYGGIGGYLKGFTEPVFVMTPMNIISEIATPLSMTFRHFGNIVSGSVITALIYGGLSVLSHAVLGLIPGAVGSVLSQIPLLQFGLPAILSLYFDFFSSFMQAFIFCTLTMVYIGGAAGN
ncbi:MAG: F0F1 ATP synthase subunit A [Clostridia bacterium]|nr:F0F1 ATP synthase subunit A [Clostridia bacterium]